MEIDLSIEARQKLFQYAENAGVAPEYIIQSFIADLTTTDGTNGQEQREAAAEWYRRTFRPEYNIYHAVGDVLWDMDTLIDLLNKIDQYKGQLASMGADDQSEDRRALEYELAILNGHIDNIRAQYYENCSGNFNKELADLVKRYKAI